MSDINYGNAFPTTEMPDEKIAKAKAYFAKKDEHDKIEKANKAATTLIRKARETVLVSNPFFGSLIYEMPYEMHWYWEWVDNAPATAYTDGRKIVYNPLFVLMLDQDELCFLLCHETLHPALQHIGRLAGRDPVIWNMACDYSINLLIMDYVNACKKTGEFAFSWKMIPCGLIDEKWRGQSPEQIYAELLKEAQKKGGGKASKPKRGNGQCPSCGGSGKSQQPGGGGQQQSQQQGQQPSQQQGQGQQGGQCPTCNGSGGGGISPDDMWNDMKKGLTEMIRGADMSPEEEEEMMKGWQDRLIQAASIARNMGKVPAGIDRLIDELYKPVIDWRVFVQQYISEISKDDYTYSRPSPRLLSVRNTVGMSTMSGIITPSLYTKRLGEVVCVLDDSGSMYHAIQHCVSEVVGIFHANYGTTLHFITCDTEAHHVCDWEPGGDEPTIEGTNPIKVVGGGGTSFVPPFHMIREMGWQPKLVLYFTDLDGTIPNKDLDPGCPVIWVVINDYHKQSDLDHSFGQLVQMTEIVGENRVKA